MKLAPVMGITRIANISGLDTIGVPVYAAHRPNSRSLSVMQGKGCTHADAKASALMEAVETYHAETIDLPLRLNSHAELGCQYNVIDVSRLPESKDRAFTPYARILWIEGADMMSGEKKFVPYEMVHLDYRVDLPCGHGCFIPSSNGLASGNHMLEALIHATCEVIETDALETWRLKGDAARRADKVSLDTVADRRCLDILGLFRRAQVHVGVWDITNGSGIPAFLCRILPDIAPDISGLRPASGMGCHLSKDVALLRALTEAAQSRLTFIAGSRDDLDREAYKMFLSPENHARWLESISDLPPSARDFSDIVSCHGDSLERDMDTLLDKLRESGIEEAVAVDLTKPAFGIPVVRVIIPGLKGSAEP